MHIPTLLATLLTLTALSASAAPTSWRNPAPFSSITALPSTSTTPNMNTLTKRNVGGVRLSTGPKFTGSVWYGIYPLNECISLGDYAHNVLSFRPDEETECMVMQGECNSEMNYTDLYYSSTRIADLGYYDFAAQLESYMCYTPIEVGEAEARGAVV